MPKKNNKRRNKRKKNKQHSSKASTYSLNNPKFQFYCKELSKAFAAALFDCVPPSSLKNLDSLVEEQVSDIMGKYEEVMGSLIRDHPFDAHMIIAASDETRKHMLHEGGFQQILAYMEMIDVITELGTSVMEDDDKVFPIDSKLELN